LLQLPAARPRARGEERPGEEVIVQTVFPPICVIRHC